MLIIKTINWRYVTPVFVLVFGLIASYLLMATRPVLIPAKKVSDIPTVSVIEIKPQTVKLTIASQGLVKARDEMDLMSEVAGKIVYLHPDFVAGGFFSKDEVLVKIDARDYDVAIVQAQAQIAEAQRLLATEQAQAIQSKKEWEVLGNGTPSRLAMREPQLAEAHAKLKFAEATLLHAKIQRSRCELRAPFSGRFQTKAVSVGQIIQAGDKLAHLYASDWADIRLPISIEQFAFLNLPDKTLPYQQGIKVTLTAQLAGKSQSWQGRIVRTEGIVDENSGVIYAVAQVKNPYRSQGKTSGLLNGLFVQAEIEGKELSNVFALPATAVNSAQQVLIVDKNSRLHSRQLQVLRNEKNRVLVNQGLNADEQVVVSEMDIPIENMQVKVNLPGFKNLEGLGAVKQ